MDWWSFGVLVYEFVAGNSPFSPHNRDVMVMYTKICEGEFKMPTYFSAPLKDLVENLLQVDMSKRYIVLLFLIGWQFEIQFLFLQVWQFD